MRPRLIALLVLATLVGALPAAGETVLGADGVLYRTLTGRYGDLVPGGLEADSAAPVLILEEQRPGRAGERHLVPGTEGFEVEASPYVLVEPSEDTIHLVWGSTEQVVHSSILLVSLHDGTWSEVIEVSGRPFTLKTTPRLAVTHDSFPFSLDSAWGRGWLQERTILHTVWWEETGLGGKVMYAPLTLINGRYTGQHEVLSLNGFDGSSPGEGAPVAPDLLIAPSIGTGDDVHTVVVAFANPDSGRVVSLRVSALPYELTQLADLVRDFIAGSEADCSSDAGRYQLADDLMREVKASGDRFNPLALEVIASSAFSFVVDPSSCSGGLQALGDAARMHIIGVGARASLRLTRQLDGKRRMHIIGVGMKSVVATGDQQFSIRPAASFPLPQIGDGPTTLFASRDGSALLVAWQGGDRLLYRETRAGEWGPVATLDLDDSFTLAQAHAVLRDRIAQRSSEPNDTP